MTMGNTPKDTYQRFIEFEEKAADIYLQLALRFSSENHELSAFWLDMAMEEKQHAVLLQFCQAERWFAPTLPVPSEIRKFAAQFRELEKRAANREITRNEAFAIAAELESSEVNAIYCHLTTPLHSSVYLFKKKIAASPFHHLDHLRAAAKKFRVPAATMKKLDQVAESCPEGWGKAS
jgi:hypothetical protein